MSKLDGKVAVVTGSGRGIGRAIAEKLAADGASVVVNDLDPGPAKETVEAIVEQGGRAFAVPGSVTERGFSDDLVDAAVAEFGDLHILVNNAGYTWDSVIQKTTDEQWDAMLDIHLTAPFRMLRSAATHFRDAARREAETGTIVTRKVVNISSVSGTGGNAGQAGYASGKAGVIGLTKTIAKEWGRYHVTVNGVAFGLIKTRLTEAPAGGDASIQINQRDIKVGIGASSWSPWSAASRSGAPVTRPTRPTPSTCSASRSPTTSPGRSCSAVVAW